jgi:transposase-like protein
MGQGNRPTTLQQRLAIWERTEQGESDAAIAAAMQLSPMTVRKWRRRAQQQGRSGLGSQIGRPQSGPLGHATPEFRQAVRQLRSERPGWGPITLRLELADDPRFRGQKLSSRSRLAAFLKHEGLTRRHERRSALVQPAAQEPSAPHDEWEMDAQGVRQVVGVGRVSVINIGDPYSHLRVGSAACLAKSKADTADYQLALRRAFLRFGRPARLSLDHDSAFFDNTSASPFPSLLHLWLIALGVEVCFIPEAQPTEHGFIERTHQVMDQQAMAAQEFPSPAALQPTLDRRLDFLNERYPSRALGGQPPLQAHPTARHSGRAYRPEQEAELLDRQRVYDYLARNRWFRQVTAMGQFTLGNHRYGLGKAWANQQVEIGFDAQTQELVCRSADGQRTQRLSIQGLTKTDLMGELDMAQFPNYQYAFPWTAEACRQNLLHEEVAGTTL